MEKILRTDNAYEAIDKINANFEESGGGEKKMIAEGELVGNGGNFAYAYINEINPGDVFVVEFPDGDWSASSATENQAKLSIGYRDSSQTRHYLFYVKRDGNVQSSYIVKLSNYYADTYYDIYIGIRANTGTTIPYTVSRWGGGVEPYFLEEMSDTIQKVKARTINDGCITFPVITDIHYRSHSSGFPLSPFSFLRATRNIAEIAKAIRFDNVVCLGDGVDGLSTAYQSNADACDLVDGFSSIGKPLLYTFGNHDDNRYYSEGNGDRRFTQAEMFANFIQPIDERTSIGGAMNGANWYRDVERNKIRFIGLCSINYSGQYSYTTETQNFLTATYASMPQGYMAVILTHVPLLSAWNNDANEYSGGTAIANIISTNIDKTIALFMGHTHRDNLFLTPFIAVNTSSNKCYNNLSTLTPAEDSIFPTRASDDYREDLWDAVVIDTTNSLLSCIRFGAGSDRYVHYTPITVAPGGTTTLTPSIITATAWHTRTSESSSISIASGVVTVASGATSGARLTARAQDADGNFEYWIIKVL